MSIGKKIAKKLNYAYIIIIIVLVIMLGISVSMLRGYGIANKQNETPDFFTTAIKGAFNDIGELATSEYAYKIAETMDKPSKKFAGLDIPFTQSKVLYSYEGSVKAGIDFVDIDVVVNESNKTIFVELPEAKILSSEVKHESLVIYDAEYSPFNKVTFEDVSLSIASLERTAKNAAEFDGLLELAKENARRIIEASIGGLYDSKEYRVEFH